MQIYSKIRYIAGLTGLLLFMLTGGCASVPMSTPEQDATAKQFKAPPPDKSALYVYRNSNLGGALKKMVAMDGKPLFESAPMTYYYTQVTPGKHLLSTESEFGDNTLGFEAEGGKIIFIRQYIKFGVFVGGANLEAVDEATGKEGVLECKRAAGFDSAQ